MNQGRIIQFISALKGGGPKCPEAFLEETSFYRTLHYMHFSNSMSAAIKNRVFLKIITPFLEEKYKNELRHALIFVKQIFRVTLKQRKIERENACTPFVTFAVLEIHHTFGISHKRVLEWLRDQSCAITLKIVNFFSTWFSPWVNCNVSLSE